MSSRGKKEFKYNLRVGLGVLFSIYGGIQIAGWSFSGIFLSFFFTMIIWSISLFYSISSVEKINSYKLLLRLIFFLLIFLSFFAFVDSFQHSASPPSEGPSFFIWMFLLAVVIVSIVTEKIREKKFDEKSILEGIKSSTYPATMAALTGILYTLTSDENRLPRTEEYTKIAVIFFIISSVCSIFYSWYIGIKEDKDENILMLFRISVAGSFIIGLFYLLSLLSSIARA